jgi:hypothetical protein
MHLKTARFFSFCCICVKMHFFAKRQEGIPKAPLKTEFDIEENQYVIINSTSPPRRRLSTNLSEHICPFDGDDAHWTDSHNSERPSSRGCEQNC